MAAANSVVSWQGGAVDELLAMLSDAGLTARVEVLPGPDEPPAGEVHLVAGGVAEIAAGSQKGDEALATLAALGAPRFRIEPRLPDPATGVLEPPGPEEGTLDERSVVELMRYCEEFVLTCLLEVWRGDEHATITYRRGEIAGTTVDRSDAPERLPEVMAWSSGRFRLVLPPLVLPRPSARPAGAPMPRSVSTVPARRTLPIAPAVETARRGTSPGMPIDVFGTIAPERRTAPGHPAARPADRPAAAAGRLALTQPARKAPPIPHEPPPPTVPPPAGLRPELPTQPPPAAMRPELPTPRRPIAPLGAQPLREGRRRRRGLGEMPVLGHALLGLLLGAVVVASYWVYRTYLMSGAGG